MTQTGLDQETRTMILDTINSLKNELLTRERILELDDKSEFPLEIVKELLSERIGLQMVFIPEEFGGLGGGGRIAVVYDSAAQSAIFGRIRKAGI